MPARLSPWISWAAFGAGVVACLMIAYASYVLAGYSWAQVVEYKSPYVSQSVPVALKSAVPTPTAELSKKVVLVIVDGMRDDVSRSGMPTLETLRTYGTDVSLVAPQPSLSFPNWTTILTGASQTISGVTTNWYKGRVLAPTIIDVARDAGRRVAVVGPTDFAELYGVSSSPTVSLRPWPKDGYLTGTLVDDALRIAKATDPQLLVLHVPDLDEAGHSFGGSSKRYKDVAAQVDADIARLVGGLQADGTTFVIVADHGHISSGGHGGWEPEVVSVPAVFSGASVVLGEAKGNLSQVAPTIAVLAGLRAPAYAESTAMRSVISTTAAKVFASGEAHHIAFANHYTSVVAGDDIPPAMFARGAEQHGGPDGYAAFARNTRIARERDTRVPVSLGIIALVVTVFAAIGFASWRSLVAAGAGAITYFALYNGLFFLYHRYLWSLSAFNTETQVKAFMNGRMIEAAFSALVGVAVAAFVYPYLRRLAWGPRDRGFLGGWLALAPATLLIILGSLALQVAWFLWVWGATITWVLPDFKWAFKYDLDLVQMTAVGAAVLLAPIVSYLIGRYHPRVRTGRETG
jgi:hypothetical protein